MAEPRAVEQWPLSDYHRVQKDKFSSKDLACRIILIQEISGAYNDYWYSVWIDPLAHGNIHHDFCILFRKICQIRFLFRQDGFILLLSPNNWYVSYFAFWELSSLILSTEEAKPWAKKRPKTVLMKDSFMCGGGGGMPD